MKTKLIPATAVLAALIVLTAISPVAAKIGGLYKGTAKKNSLGPPPGSPPSPKLKFGTTPIKLRLPNGKGKISGVLESTKTPPPKNAPVNSPLEGLIRKVESRQGGKKTILKGRLKMTFPAAMTSLDGRIRFVIKKFGSAHQLKSRLKLTNSVVTFRSRITCLK